MTLLETIRTIEGLATKQPSVNQVVQNDVFRLNTIPDAKYGVFAWTQGQHTIGTDIQTFAFTFFYVDRLTADKGNEIEVQSVGIQTLSNIIRGLEDLGIYVSGEWTAQTFNQRFLDECAGVFASVRLEVPAGLICADDFLNPEPQPDPKDGPLHFVILTDGGFNWEYESGVSTRVTIQYRINDGEWANLAPQAAADGEHGKIPVSAGDIVYFRGNKFTGATSGRSGDYHHFNTTCEFNVCGHLNSLILGDDYEQETAGQRYGWRGLFSQMVGLKSAEHLVLPHTLAERIFAMMFYQSGLTIAPPLPATTLAPYCYQAMFDSCVGLTTAPELPATTLAEGCYNQMFVGCTGLTAAPELPATTLAEDCYAYMFYRCTGLEESPTLPAKELVHGCYMGMFMSCGNLRKVTFLAESIKSGAINYVNNWLYLVSNSGTFIKSRNGIALERGYSGIPAGWTIEEV